MSNSLAATKEQHAIKADHITKNIAYKVTCIMALEAIEDATTQLLLTPEEHAILNQASTLLEVNRVHYSTTIERLAHYGQN